MRNLETKKDIRKRVLKIRSAIPEEVQTEKSRIICESVIKHPYFQKSDVLFCYMNFRDEVHTDLLIQTAREQNKRVAVPKVEGDLMEFFFITGPDDLEAGYFGIPEPDPSKCIRADHIGEALMIVPGTAFDVSCNRMGYGKGFYDRYLSGHSGYHTIGIGYAEQIIPDLPTEETDQKLDFVITDENIYQNQTIKSVEG